MRATTPRRRSRLARSLAIGGALALVATACGGDSDEPSTADFVADLNDICQDMKDEMHALADEWREQLAPGADGWLGGTYGFTDDGMFVGVVRFEDREKAMANSQRPEQSAWAERMAALFDGPVEFHDSDDVTLLFDGGSDDARFVQVIRGKVDDPSRLRAMMTDTQMLHEMRPDILGATLATLVRTDLGVPIDGALTVAVGISDRYSDPARIRGYFDELSSRIRQLPRITAVGATSRTPLCPPCPPPTLSLIVSNGMSSSSCTTTTRSGSTP